MFKNVKKEEITIPAQMSYLIQIREFIEHIGKRYKFSDKVINSFKLVVDEACTNVIRHGYRDIKNGEIQLKAIIRRMSLTIVIIDQGISYDPRQANTPDLAKYVDIGKKGGLGILMMRKLMDDIHYAVTERGNEFRLTKYREEIPDGKVSQLWHSMTMRARYTLISAVLITVTISLIFSVLMYNMNDTVRDETLNMVSGDVKTLADNSIDDIISDQYIPMFEKVRSLHQNNPELINEAFITDTRGRVIARSTLLRETPLGRVYTMPDSAVERDSVQNSVVLNYAINDTTRIYDVYSEIRESISGTGAALGYAHVWIREATLRQIVYERRMVLLLIMLILLMLGYIGSFFLINQVLKSFHSLGDWVRQVVRGTVDQDEIDIDASDEIGEIAQAFNEMTQKFHAAQVNLMEQQKLQKELQVAQEIQQMLLPSDFPRVEGFDIGSYYEAAKEVGGDLFDFVEVDDETVGIVVADVSGKGVPGSLIMTMIRTAIRLESRGNKNPADVLAKVNRFVTDDMKRGMFVTMFYVILDSRNRVIHYASAGHNPMILYRSSTKQTYYLNPSGFPVGIQLPDLKLFDDKIETDSIRLREDDILVLYTDGITEAMNHQRELYREERFLESIRSNGHLDVTEFVKTIKDDLKNFTGGAPQNDDITFVAIKEKMMAGEIIYKTHKQMVELIEQGVRVKDACERLNISQYQYYKYKSIVDEGGLDALRAFLDGQDHIEKKHLSIEVKAKIFDIIRQNPRFGPKKISDLLNTEKYGFVELDQRRIYNELIKMRLNTYTLRKRFLEKGQNKRLKQPGTPLLTMDGKVILNFESSESEVQKRLGTTPPKPVSSPSPSRQEEKKPFVRVIKSASEKEEEKTPPPRPKQVKPEAAQPVAEPKKEEKKAEKAEQTDKTISETVPTTEQLRARAREVRSETLINQYYDACRDDLLALQQHLENIKPQTDNAATVRKMLLILKITTKNPILKKLPEFSQLIQQGVKSLEILAEAADDTDAPVLKKRLRDVLNVLKKENILKAGQSILEQVNTLAVMRKSWYESPAAVPEKNPLDDIRQKLARKKIVHNSELLKKESSGSTKK
ncbi:MAG: HAMP domain-containing protein [Calditrichaeota bacterium]|nr:MAG: HAMP domain-containing protein [Calditrichota bacterium]